MFLSKKTDRWRSSGSRLIGLYALFFVAWGAMFTGVLYWEISRYLGSVAERTLMQRAHYYQKVSDEALISELAEGESYSTPGLDAYGLFEADGRHLTGNLRKLRANLPMMAGCITWNGGYIFPCCMRRTGAATRCELIAQTAGSWCYRVTVDRSWLSEGSLAKPFSGGYR